jgi:pilus assembly protein CpaE
MALANVLSKAARAQPKQLVAIVADAESRAVVAEAIERRDLPQTEIISGTVATAVAALAKMPTPKRIFVDLSGSDDAFKALSTLADVCDSGTRVIACGETNDVTLYRNLLAAGLDDYLVKPLTADAILDAWARQEEPQIGDGDGRKGRLIAVMGSRGGAGATTVATSCAWLLAHELGMRTALVDLDLYFGSCALFLDLDTGPGLREALENPDRMDSLFVERAMVRESERLYVLSSEDDLDNAHNFDPLALQLLLDHLRTEFPCIVLDLPRFAARTQISLLSAPVSVVLVSEPSLVGMRDTKRMAKAIRKNAPHADLRVVLNRIGVLKGGELLRKDFEQGAEVQVSCQFPFLAKAAAASAGSGKPLAKTAGRSKTMADFRRLAMQVGDVEVKSAGRGTLRRLLRMGR